MSKNTARSSNSSVKRLFYVDNLRIYLISLVVLHHVAVGYGGGVGSWPIKESPTDEISPIILLIFLTINQSYITSLFYLLSGYFAPGSYDKKGTQKFLIDRLIRLGIPVLIHIVFIASLIDYIVLKFTQGQTVSFFKIMVDQLGRGNFKIGPLWFIEALLIFSVVYVLYRLILNRFRPNFTFNPYKDACPTNKAIILSIVAIALGTFVVRLIFPVGVGVADRHFRLEHFTHYIFCFWLGILAYRGKWFHNLSKSQGKLWGIVALLTIPFLLIIFVLGGAADNVEPFLGGLYWQAFVYALWESIACLSIIIGLLYFFQTKFNRQGNLLKAMSANAYTVYINHQFVITVIMVILLPVVLPTAVKFFLVALIGLPMCFIVSHFVIRKIPYSTRVLG